MWEKIFSFYFYPAIVILELWLSRKRSWENYSLSETLTSLGMRILTITSYYFTIVMFRPFYEYAYQYRLFTWNLPPMAEHLLYFVLADFNFYLTHYLSHKVPALWSGHMLHHSFTKMNFINGRRMNFIDPMILIYLYFSIFMVLGFKLDLFLFYSALTLQYQVIMHTDLVPKLGFIDKVFNTPSNHRVHHGTIGLYADKNFGGITVIFDHIFGTYQAEQTDIKHEYGLIGRPAVPKNPLRLAVFGIECLYREWKTGRRGLFSTLFKFPLEPLGTTKKNVA